MANILSRESGADIMDGNGTPQENDTAVVCFAQDI